IFVLTPLPFRVAIVFFVKGAELHPSIMHFVVETGTKRTQWRRPTEKILFTEGLDQEPVSFAGATWSYASKLTHRHGQALSRNLGVLMGVNVSAAFMDGHVQTIDENFSHDNRQIWFDDRDPN